MDDFRIDDFQKEERERRRENRTQRERPGKGQAAKRDYMVRIIAIQAVVCAVLLALAILAYKVGGKTFLAMRDIFEKYAGAQSVEEIQDVLSDIKNFIFQPAEVWSKQPGEVGDTTTATGQPQPDTQPQEGGQGGADLPITGTLYEPTKQASFAPYYITAPFVEPVEGAKVTSAFGHRIHPISGEDGFHAGIDLAVPAGTRIAAAFYGQVKVASEDSTSGKYIILEHANGLQTVYCHCSQLLAPEGAWVRAGETIALVGSTGAATGPHLHLEVRIGGVRRNPAWLLGLSGYAV